MTEPISRDIGAYASRLAPAVFDFMISWIYWPTSISAIRERIVDLLELGQKTSVLELGSGTGGVTEILIRRGATVTCVDQAPMMIDRARRRAPVATFVNAEARHFRADEHFDRALLVFFLHEQDATDRVAILARAAEHLVPGGFLVVADSASPESGPGRALWRGFLRIFEPATVLEVADGALATDLLEAGLEVTTTETYANGRVRAYVARRKGEA